MPHPLVEQLRFARSEFRRCLVGVTEEDAGARLAPMNCISWIVGHMANQENRYWVVFAQQLDVAPELDDLLGLGKPASAPSLEAMWAAWRTVTTNADTFLNGLDSDQLDGHLSFGGRDSRESVGTMLYRNIYHYWFHIGEAHAIRQQLGHGGLPQFVGDMEAAAYRSG